MHRKYYEYTEWEDYKHGMYESKADEFLFRKAQALLKNSEKLKRIAQVVVNKWAVCTEENLTNDSCNKTAWLGQASCCYEYGVPECITKKAWGTLNEFEQFRANKAVNMVVQNWIDEYLNRNKKQLNIYGEEN